MLAATIVLSFSTAVIAASSPATQAASFCPDVAFYGARGSGELSDSFNGLGPEVYSMMSELRARLGPQVTMAVSSNPYNADSTKELQPSDADAAAAAAALAAGPVAVEAFLLRYKSTHVDPYLASLAYGVDQFKQMVHVEATVCPHTFIVLAGYSQGAMAAHQAENQMASDDPGVLGHVAGTMLLGDGDRTHDTASAQFGTISDDGEGIQTYFAGAQGSHDVESPLKTVEICNANDIVCDWQGIYSVIHHSDDSKVHTTYAPDPSKSQWDSSFGPAAQYIADLLREHLPTITSLQVPELTPGVPFSFELTGTGGRAPYAWSALDPLPAGVTLNGSTVSGTMDMGVATAKIRLTDAALHTADVHLRFVSGVDGGGGGEPPSTNASTYTSVQSTVNPSVFGQSVQFSVNVSSAGGAPTGSVYVYDDGDLISSGGLSSGKYAFSTSGLSVGAHDITASYSGGSGFDPSSSGAFIQVVDKAATSTDLHSSDNPIVYCQTVTFNSHVSVVPPGAGLPTGSVNFTDGGQSIGSGGLDGSANASLATQFFHVGTHPIVASYGGDSSFLDSSSSTLNEVVNKAPTVTTVTSSPSGTNLFGRNSTFTATISVPPPGCGTPTGTVKFAVDGVQVQTGGLPNSLQATLSTTALLPGTHVISAGYSGDENFLASSGTANYLVTCTRTITGKVSGDVSASGESTCLVNAKLSGAVTVPAGTRVALVNSSITGAFVSNVGANMIAICGSSVGGTAQVEKNRELVMVGDPGAVCDPNTINGSLLLRYNSFGVEAIKNKYGGSLSDVRNSGPGPYGQTTTISGNTKR